MNDQPNTPHRSPFDAIRHKGEDGSEYWSDRELYKLLGYSSWQKFQYAVEQAKIACKKSGYAIADHFNLQVKMVKLGSGSQRKVEDYQLSRYACYLIIQNEIGSLLQLRSLEGKCRPSFCRACCVRVGERTWNVGQTSGSVAHNT
jgi:hypothetical protein